MPSHAVLKKATRASATAENADVIPSAMAVKNAVTVLQTLRIASQAAEKNPPRTSATAEKAP